MPVHAAVCSTGERLLAQHSHVMRAQANIQRLADGLFLECARQVASKYPDIEFRELIIDNACMQVCTVIVSAITPSTSCTQPPTQLVQNPNQVGEVMCMPNLYGDIISDLCAGLVGGLGLVASMNVGAWDACGCFLRAWQ